MVRYKCIGMLWLAFETSNISSMHSCKKPQTTHIQIKTCGAPISRNCQRISWYNSATPSTETRDREINKRDVSESVFANERLNYDRLWCARCMSFDGLCWRLMLDHKRNFLIYNEYISLKFRVVLRATISGWKVGLVLVLFFWAMRGHSVSDLILDLHWFLDVFVWLCNITDRIVQILSKYI